MREDNRKLKKNLESYFFGLFLTIKKQNTLKGNYFLI